MSITAIIIWFILLYGGFILLVLLIYRILENRQKIDQLVVRDWTTLEILVPKNNEKGPLAAEQMFATIHGIYEKAHLEQEHISLEIVSKDKYILFYAAAPTHLKDFIEGQIYAQYPTVEINEVDPYTEIASDNLTLTGTHLVLNKNEVFPIKTVDNFEVDPLSSITGVLSKIEDKQQIWIQILLRPVGDDWQDQGVKYVQAIRSGVNPQGKSLGESFFQGVKGIAQDVLSSSLNLGGASKESGENSGSETGEEVKLSGPEEAGLASIEEKITKLGFQVGIRVIVLAENEVVARSKLAGVVGAFKQFNATNINGFSISEISSDLVIYYDYIRRTFPIDHAYILNTSELASIWHLPSTTVLTPAIAWAGSKKGEPPSNLPTADTQDKGELTIFGQTNFRHYLQVFGIKSRDRRLHFYAIGKTGVGKSTMLENMIYSDIIAGRGVAVVDPHGDLIDHVLSFIPDNRVEDVVYFAPADRDYPIGFNILESVDPDLKSIIASGVVGIFKKIFGESWGPRLEYILRNTVLSLIDYPNATMLGITRMLVDKEYRKKVVASIEDPVIYDFWVNEFDKYDQKFRSEAVAPIQNKVGQFLSTSTIRNIVGQSKSTIDLTDIMNNKKILLIDLSIGKIGEDIAALLGAMMITKIQLSAMQRASIPEPERIDFYLYVDEFQNFATDSFAVILSEARKYHLNLIMTNQYIAQMPETVQNAVFGNVGTLVSFRVGAQDAAALVREFEPVFDANDLVNLDNRQIYVKMAIDGVTSTAFSASTLPPAQGETNNNRARIIAASRQKYSSNREEIEAAIKQDSNLSEKMANDQYWRKTGESAPADPSMNLEQEMLEAKAKLLGYERRKGKEAAWYVKTPPAQEAPASVAEEIVPATPDLPVAKPETIKAIEEIPTSPDDDDDPLGIKESPDYPDNQPLVPGE